MTVLSSHRGLQMTVPSPHGTGKFSKRLLQVPHIPSPNYIVWNHWLRAYEWGPNNQEYESDSQLSTEKLRGLELTLPKFDVFAAHRDKDVLALLEKKITQIYPQRVVGAM